MNTTQAQLGAVCGRRATAQRLLESTESRLAEIAQGHGVELARYATGTLFAGGKRLRPMLVFLCANEGDGRLVEAGTAVELLHMATLVHDDVLDRAALRRGRPTVFAEGGRLAATATGDLLFSRAFAGLAATDNPDAVRALSAASSALARGELMQRADAWRADVTPERYLERCRLKTASLFEASCRLGALFGDRPDLAGRVGRFGEQIGLAFQCSTTCSTCRPSGAHRKRWNRLLMHGHVPLILALRTEPGLTGRPRPSARRRRHLRRIVASGALEQAREGGGSGTSRGKAGVAQSISRPSAGARSSSWPTRGGRYA